jgi:hypothetical protein
VPADVQGSRPKLDLIPAQVHQFGSTQAVRRSRLGGRLVCRARVSCPSFANLYPQAWRNMCGCALKPSLASALGHKNIQHTVRYTESAPTRFKDFWRK